MDLNGDSITVSQEISDNYVLNTSFEVFAKSKEGQKFLSNYASAGQTLYGHTFAKDGKYHKKGVNLNYATFYRENSGDRGEAGAVDGTITVKINSFLETGSQNGETYSWSAYPKMSKDKANVILSKAITFFHESFIHADLYTQDFIDDNSINHSNIPASIINHNKWYTSSTEHLQHHTVFWNGDNQLWPGSAYKGILEVNTQLGLKYSSGVLRTMMWNYNGGRPIP